MPYQENKEYQALMRKVERCFAERLPFAVYRKPQEKLLTAVFQQDDSLQYSNEFKESGFVFAPFHLIENAVLIKADEVVSVNLDLKKEITYAKAEVSPTGKTAHIKLVSKGIQEIMSGELRKVVLSRKLDVALHLKAELIFERLLENYPNAFCYLWYHPRIGTWSGATPETLVMIQQQKLRTMSLAATLPYKENSKPVWGKKEIDEQAMVSDYITDRLSNLTTALNISEPESVKAGNLWHLKSEINGTLLPGAMGKIIKALHPTPAVCGIPTAKAKNFIDENEEYQRTYYTGFLGELNLKKKNEVSLYVNLRCMEIFKGKASLFVGGGITAASNPESEWTEIQNKSQTLLNIL